MSRGQFVKKLSKYFFKIGGQINLNVLDLEDMKVAMAHSELQESKEIVVKVAGYSAHFICLDRKFQGEFVQRVD